MDSGQEDGGQHQQLLALALELTLALALACAFLSALCAHFAMFFSPRFLFFCVCPSNNVKHLFAHIFNSVQHVIFFINTQAHIYLFLSLSFSLSIYMYVLSVCFCPLHNWHRVCAVPQDNKLF